MRAQRERFRGLLIAALLVGGFALKGWLIEPPTAARVSSPDAFDTDRAVGRLKRILGDQRPHPVDSAADDAVRDRLITELRSLGLDPRIQDRTDCSAVPKSRVVSCARVRNIIATIPGRRPGPQLLLNAHYDSTATGPGAADDGLGVAVLLEVGSILKDVSAAAARDLAVQRRGRERSQRRARLHRGGSARQAGQFAHQRRCPRRYRAGADV